MSGRLWTLLFCQWQEEIRHAGDQIEALRTEIDAGHIPANIAADIARLEDRQRAILQQIDALISATHNSRN